MFPVLTKTIVQTEFPKIFYTVTNKCEAFVYYYRSEGAHIIFKTRTETDWRHEKYTVWKVIFTQRYRYNGHRFEYPISYSSIEVLREDLDKIMEDFKKFIGRD